ncbi:amidase signature enzyme [Ophiobolus disseminans]|uniref:Amidase signature enzyme n=1 Tax=Ophiobolus disseminans TaxID=1469910 RepID=A0A6A6ZDW0_9PLEO|nr:amidase signature enzyme [Ophiobolus disseminans]
MVQSIVRSLTRGVYFVHPQEVVRLGSLIESAAGSEPWTPAVLLFVPDDEFGAETAQNAFEDFSRRDDVFSSDFSSTLILQTCYDVDILHVANRLMQSSLFRTVHVIEPTNIHGLLPSGPYFIRGKSIHQAWKLYEDDLDAFVIPTIPDYVFHPQSFSVLQAVSIQGSFRSIAVPSRLYSSVSKEKPLAGARIRTTMMNRAYDELYPARSSTADYIAKLIELGAVIVGKTKMSAFASAEEPTDQWVDYHCPFNPRGDNDTSGSIRSPPALNGLFGLRTSYGIASTRGIVPSCNEFDTVGTLHRSLKDAKHLITEILDVTDSSQFPKRLLYPSDFFPQADAEQQSMSDDFISIIEEFLGVKKTPISMTDTWASNPPSEAGAKTLQEYLEMSAVWPMYDDTYHTFDKFRKDYRDKFGKDAFVGPYMRKRWSIAVPFTVEERAQGVAEMKLSRTCIAVMIMPFGSPCPKYRDDYNKLPSVVSSFSIFYLPTILQLPVLIVPIGQKPYDSRITGVKEYLPIVSSLMGAKGSDALLINLAEAVLEKAGWPTTVKTGREMFERGGNVRNVL